MSYFEFDEFKSDINQHKHGIDFVDAQALWDDPDAIVLKAKSTEEERFLLVAFLDDNYWSAIYTMRASKIRIISVRRAREKEVLLYES